MMSDTLEGFARRVLARAKFPANDDDYVVKISRADIQEVREYLAAVDERRHDVAERDCCSHPASAHDVGGCYGWVTYGMPAHGAGPCACRYETKQTA